VPDPADAVSGATETPVEETEQSSSTDTQASEEQEAPAVKADYRKLHREDPDLNAYIQSELAKARNKWERQQVRTRAAQIVEAGDKDAALDVTRYVANEQDEDEQVDTAWADKAERVQPQLDHLLRLNAQGQATNEWYIRVHQKYGKAEMDKRYAADPLEFLNWVDDEIQDMRVEAKLKKVAPSLAEAMATDQVNRQLAKAGAPLTGGAGSGTGLSPEQWEAMTWQQRQEIRQKNPKQIDDMVARYSR
jgi:hypothetical protein